jgi:RNA polymerase sigma-70 factor (ECF subfamily)
MSERSESLDEISDFQLVESCLEGDDTAWKHIVQRYQRLIYNLAYRFTGRFELAEELSQEIFLKIYRSLKKYRKQRGEFKGWITVMARNYLIDYIRKEKKKWTRYGGTDELETLDYKTEDISPYGHVEKTEKIQFVHRCLGELSVDLRESLILREIEGMSYDEIADQLNAPLGTIKSRINRARIELARIVNMRRLSGMTPGDYRPTSEEAS